MTTILVPRGAKLNDESAFTKREKVDANLHPGRRTKANGYQSPASWVMDLADLKKIIILCSFCRPKFDPRKHGYRRMQLLIEDKMDFTSNVNGVCDSCKQKTFNMGGGAAFVHEQFYNQVCTDPVEARREARIRARRALSPYEAIQRS
jgi:hypothetical protein